MIELPLIFVSGVLGSAHCLGMCGPLALMLGQAKSRVRQNLVRQLIYSAGRIFTYGVLGACAGFAGMRMAASLPALINIPAVLAIVAGAFLFYQGLLAADWLPRRGHVGSSCLGSSFLATFLRGPALRDVFLAGLFTGFLPCGLLYGYVAMAAGSASMGRGILVMVTFGLGTVPVMIATGFGSSLLGLAARRRLFRLAAYSVMLAGAVSIYRGLGFLGTEIHATTTICPFCW